MNVADIDAEFVSEIPPQYTETCPVCEGQRTVPDGIMFTWSQIKEYDNLPRHECDNCHGTGRVPSIEKLWLRVKGCDASG